MVDIKETIDLSYLSLQIGNRARVQGDLMIYNLAFNAFFLVISTRPESHVSQTDKVKLRTISALSSVNSFQKPLNAFREIV